MTEIRPSPSGRIVLNNILEEQKPQPPPKQGGIEVYTLLNQYLKDTIGENNEYLRKKLTERYEFGKKKYGTALQTDNGRDVVRDAEEEVLDLIYYLVSCLHSKKDITNLKIMIQTVDDIIENHDEDPNDKQGNSHELQEEEDDKIDVSDPTSRCAIL